MSLWSWLKRLSERGAPAGDIDAIRADQGATLAYGVTPEQAERISRRDAEELERAESETE
jgi:hypothetical protein